jgi:hypothetical protein
MRQANATQMVNMEHERIAVGILAFPFVPIGRSHLALLLSKKDLVFGSFFVELSVKQLLQQ